MMFYLLVIGQAKLQFFTDEIKLYSFFNVIVFNCGDLQQSVELLLFKHQYNQI